MPDMSDRYPVESAYRCRIWDERDLPESITAQEGRTPDA